MARAWKPPPLPPLIVDCFAGGGGTSLGIELALGRSPHLALNHSQEAIAQHAINHPYTLHLCQDVWRVDPRSVSAGRKVGLLWASPDCTHFSKAKAGRPVSRRIRELAWGVVRWAKTVEPDVILVENVEEFEGWGPLGVDNLPDPSRRGQSFRRWVRELRRHRYQVEWRRLCAADYGAPTTRVRLFVVARRDGVAPQWPSATHGPGRAPYRTILDCIDWREPMHEVYGRLAAKTIARIEEGIHAFVLGLNGPEHVRRDESSRLFAAFIAQHNLGQVGKPLSASLPSITTRDSHALVTVELLPSPQGPVRHAGKRYRLGPVCHRMLAPRELARAMGFPDSFQLIGPRTRQAESIGNAVCPPIASALVAANYDRNLAWLRGEVTVPRHEHS